MHGLISSDISPSPSQALCPLACDKDRSIFILAACRVCRDLCFPKSRMYKRGKDSLEYSSDAGYLAVTEREHSCEHVSLPWSRPHAAPGHIRWAPHRKWWLWHPQNNESTSSSLISVHLHQTFWDHRKILLNKCNSHTLTRFGWWHFHTNTRKSFRMCKILWTAVRAFKRRFFGKFSRVWSYCVLDIRWRDYTLANQS